jgi:hypothetical protein
VSDPHDPHQQFARIDAIRSVAQMRRELGCLPEELRQDVILRALKQSRHQFVWSFFAEAFGISASLWPPPPGEQPASAG